MSRAPVRDLLVGLFVLAGLGAVAYLSFSVGGLSFGGPPRMALYADFDEIGGLKPRAQVVIAGVKVGQVGSITLDEGYRARTQLEVDAALKLPIDTSASIMTAGLLGDRYISLQVGGDEKLLQPGDQITMTESAVVLERVIGKLIYSGSAGGSAGEKKQ
jgi:phospholipid/cholesterol/gamma-HCH transport system substrate-binding protein